MPRKITKIIIFIAIISIAFALYFILRVQKVYDNNSPKNIISPIAQDPPKAAENSAPENKTESNQKQPVSEEKPASQTPGKYLLNIPFYSQAPLSKWDAFHEEMCEEASILNAGLYLEGKKLTKDQFEAELQKIQRLEKEKIGEWKSTTASQTKIWADVYFGGNVNIKIIDNPAIYDIETEIAAGNPVVVPLAGQDIGNPNFTPPGPVYHMLVIKGYDSQNFITNDVGTKKGNSYPYKKEVIMNNIRDWNAKNIRLGARRVLVLYK
jgi:hypothetical protein